MVVTEMSRVMVEKDLKCIVCSSKVTVELQSLFDTRFGIEGEYDIGRCEACGTEQILPLPSPENLKNLYDIYYNFGGEKGTIYTCEKGDRFIFWKLGPLF